MAQAVIGIVGLDPLTTAMARRLAGTGARVLVHDRQPERTAALAGCRPGIEIAGSLADIGGECRTVLVWRPTLESLGEALFGTEDRTGLGHELATGSLVIDLSPGSPALPPRLQGALGGRAIGIVDAGVLAGGPDAALAGTLDIALGGFAEFVDRAEAVLSPLGRIHRSGRLGSARAARTVATALRAVLHKAALEAEALGLAAGLAPEVAAAMIELARQGAQSRAGTVPDMAAIAIDAAAAVALADELHLRAPLAASAAN